MEQIFSANTEDVLHRVVAIAVSLYFDSPRVVANRFKASIWLHYAQRTVRFEISPPFIKTPDLKRRGLINAVRSNPA
jgi:hypothetical protein